MACERVRGGMTRRERVRRSERVYDGVIEQDKRECVRKRERE